MRPAVNRVDAIGSTLAHPDQQGHRESYRGAASRGDILVLERFDRSNQLWQVAGFIECHLRVDDNLSIHDIGTTGDTPQIGVVRYLLDQAFNSFRPVESQVKIRRDATTWLDIFRNIPGFHLEGEEYRRPHYWTIWHWDREQAREDERRAQQPAARPGQPAPRAPRPPGFPTGPSSGKTNGPAQRGPRPAGEGARPATPGSPTPRGPREGPNRPAQRGPRPKRPGGPDRPGGRPSRPPNSR